MVDLKITTIETSAAHFDYEIPFKKTDSFAQRLMLKLNTWLNEYAYDLYDGVDYTAVFKNNAYDSEKIESFFLSALLANMEDFENFEDFEMQYKDATGEAFISFTAYSKTGQSAKIEQFQI